MDARFLLIVIVLCLTITLSRTYQDKQCTEGKRCKKYFNYTINNQLQPPYFKADTIMRIYPFAPMIRYMEEAVIQKRTGFINFIATFSSPYGYFIDSINNLAGTYAVNKTYWQISNSSGPLNVGVSSYIPAPDDKILFNFTQGGH